MKTVLSIILSVCLAYGALAQATMNPAAIAGKPASQHVAVLLKCQATLDHYTFTQISAKLIPGNLPVKETAPPQLNDFEIVVLDDYKNPLDTVIIRKPFEQLPATASDNATKQYRKVTKDSHQSMIRFNYNPTARFMMINQVGKDGARKTVAIMPLIIDKTAP